MPPGFVRFVVHQLDPDSRRRQGLFQALGELDKSGQLSGPQELEYRTLRNWFSTHLAEPDRLARSSKANALNVAISWFKDTATEHIRQMRRMADILEAHGIPIVMLRSRRPGYVVYEDDHQVAAEPYSDTGA